MQAPKTKGHGARPHSLGPFMLAKLHTVHATCKDRAQTKTVSIASKRSTQTAFYWNVELLERSSRRACFSAGELARACAVTYVARQHRHHQRLLCR